MMSRYRRLFPITIIVFVVVVVIFSVSYCLFVYFFFKKKKGQGVGKSGLDWIGLGCIEFGCIAVAVNRNGPRDDRDRHSSPSIGF